MTRAIAAVLLLATAPALAAAAEPDPGEAASERGRTAFKAGRFEEARGAFRQALAAFPAGHPSVPRTLYNLGRTDQELGDHCAAADDFRRYLEVPGVERPEEQKRLAKVRAALEAESAACAPPPPVVVASAAPAGEPPPPAVIAASAPPVEAAPGRDLLWPSVATSGALVVLGAGLWLNLEARDQADASDRAWKRFVASGRTDADAAAAVGDRADEAERDATLSYVGFGVGAGLAGLALWLWLSPGDTATAGPVARGPGLALAF